MNGINIQAGIFMSYIGLWSYYNFDNWTYQPSYVSSNTPWFFNGMRVQIFPTDKLKIEPWLDQRLAVVRHVQPGSPASGLQILWRPTGLAHRPRQQVLRRRHARQLPGRKRIHTDDSVMVKYYDNPDGVPQQGRGVAHARRGLRVGRRAHANATGTGGR